MKLLTIRIGFILFLLFSQISLAKEINSIILAPGPIQVELTNSLQWLKADHSTLSLVQLLNKSNVPFKRLTEKAVLEAQDTYWLRLHVSNPMTQNIPLALTLSSSSIIIDGAYEQKNNQWQRINSVEPHKQLSSHSALILNINSLSEQWLYFRIKPIQTSRLEPKLQDLSEYAKNFTVMQQILGAMVSLMVFISFIHLVAIRFHNHIRHYMTIYLAFIGFCFGLSHSQLSHWPNWFLEFAKLSPWSLACMLFLSSYSTEQYRVLLKSNRTVVAILILLLITLLLSHSAYLAVLILAVIPCLLVAYKFKQVGINLTIANLILSGSVIWQITYIINPDGMFAPEGIWHVYAVTLCVLFASLSMITPYFQRQIRRKKSHNQVVNNQFLENLSHDFRTPMNGVLGMAELLNETPLSANQRDYVDTILFSGNDMLRMINRVSDYAKVQSGLVQLEKNTIHLAELSQQCLSKFQYNANQKGLELVLNIDDELPLYIAADEHRLETILDNLLDNAVRETEYGEIELRIGFFDEHKMLMFSVRDTGTGIDKDVIKYIQNTPESSEFQQMHNQGFGLSLCKKLIEIMGGNLIIESRADKGSIFSFSLPLEAVDSLHPNEQDSAEILKGLSILIVDDNSTLRKVIQRYANSWGMQSDSTYNGKEALALLRSQSNLDAPYDAILIDQDMPIMDGFQLAKRIQEDNDIDPSIIKIMLTGMSISNTQKEVIQFGIHQVITKPISAHSLKQVLAKHVLKRQSLKRFKQN